MNELITIKQLPVIEERFKEISASAQAKIADALALECTDENIQTVKKLRTDLRNDFNAYEERRKDVDRAIREQLQPFTDAYKMFISDVYKPADTELKSRIDALENEKKEKMRNEAKAYFDEYAQSKGIDFVSFERSEISVTLSVTVTKLKKQSKAFIDKIVDDLALIDTQEHKAEILVEYKKTLNVSAAITSVSERMKAIEAERVRVEERERFEKERAAAVAKVKEQIDVDFSEALTAPIEMPTQEPLTAPVVESENDIPVVYPTPTFTVTFTITDTKERLIALKQYIMKEGYKYE